MLCCRSTHHICSSFLIVHYVQQVIQHVMHNSLTMLWLLHVRAPVFTGSAGTKPPGSSSSGGGTNPELVKQGLADRQQYIQKQQRWLLFLRHCAKCQQSEEECQFGRSCRVGKDLWTHILSCNSSQCQYPRCTSSKDLLKHHQKCQVCVRGSALMPHTPPRKGSSRGSKGDGGGRW